MGDWTDNFNSVFFLSVFTIFASSVGLGLATCFKSKCTKCSCSLRNGIEIIRDVEAENDAEEIQQHTIIPQPNIPQLNEINLPQTPPLPPSTWRQQPRRNSRNKQLPELNQIRDALSKISEKQETETV
jgi:hypothetical protein